MLPKGNIYILLLGNYFQVISGLSENMLKLQLVRNGEILFEIPLSQKNLPKQQFLYELEAMEERIQRMSRIFDALSNETRLKMMRKMLQDNSTTRFADFMQDLDLNPKLVWDNVRKLRNGGLLNKTARGEYQCSELGKKTFVMMNLALKYLLEEIEEF